MTTLHLGGLSTHCCEKLGAMSFRAPAARPRRDRKVATLASERMLLRHCLLQEDRSA